MYSYMTSFWLFEHRAVPCLGIAGSNEGGTAMLNTGRAVQAVLQVIEISRGVSLLGLLTPSLRCVLMQWQTLLEICELRQGVRHCI